MATMKTLNGYGFNATELNGKTSDNYLLITDTASDSAKLGGKVPEHYLQPRNLLDNSDFRNPVNQRGATSYTGAGYTIDRWENNSAACKLTVENGCIHMQNNSDSTSTATQFIRQKIENPSALIGKTITIAARVKGNCRLGCEGIGLTYPNYVNYAAWTTITLTVDISAMTDSYIAAVLQGKNKSEWYCSWIALYEGSYTADTLPPYVSKGYEAELMACRRYLVPVKTTCLAGYTYINAAQAQFFVPLTVPLRTAGTGILPTVDVVEYGTLRAMGSMVAPVGISTAEGWVTDAGIVLMLELQNTDIGANQAATWMGMKLMISADL